MIPESLPLEDALPRATAEDMALFNAAGVTATRDDVMNLVFNIPEADYPILGRVLERLWKANGGPVRIAMRPRI